MPLKERTIVLLMSVCAIAAAAGARPQHTLKIATLAPEGSAWMTAFAAIQKDVLDATGGKVGIKVYPGGVMGEEKDVMFKIKAGQMHGGGFLGFGVNAIAPDSMTFMAPLLFKDFGEVDAVFAKMLPFLEQRCLANGFVALGWTEIGFTYLYSAVPIRTLEQLRGTKTWAMPGDRITEALLKAGKISSVPVPVSDVLTALQTGLIETTFAPPLAAVSMQWFTKVRYRTDVRLLYSLGGLFVSEQAWTKIPADMRATVSEICHRRMAALTQEVRKSNDEAIGVMERNGVETVASGPEGRRQFDELSEQAIDRMKGSIFSEEAYALLLKYLAEYRAAQGKAKPEQ